MLGETGHLVIRGGQEIYNKLTLQNTDYGSSCLLSAGSCWSSRKNRFPWITGKALGLLSSFPIVPLIYLLVLMLLWWSGTTAWFRWPTLQWNRKHTFFGFQRLYVSGHNKFKGGKKNLWSLLGTKIMQRWPQMNNSTWNIAACHYIAEAKNEKGGEPHYSIAWTTCSTITQSNFFGY